MVCLEFNFDMRNYLHLTGLHDVIQPSWLQMFDWKELQIMISGSAKAIDIDDLEAHTKYTGEYHAKHKTIVLFWQVRCAFWVFVYCGVWWVKEKESSQKWMAHRYFGVKWKEIIQFLNLVNSFLSFRTKLHQNRDKPFIFVIYCWHTRILFMEVM